MSTAKTSKHLRFTGFYSVWLAIFFLIMTGLAKGQSGVEFAKGEPGILKLSIVDNVSQEPTPARVELLDAQGNGHVAADALPVGGDCDDHAVPLTLEQALARLSKNVSNPYTRTTQFYSVGNSEITLPPGAYQLTVFKGIEYQAQRRKILIQAGETTQLTVQMSRWINMPERGWYSADGHLHIPRPIKGLNSYISKQMQAEDVHVANLLQWGHSKYFNNSIQYAHGPESGYREGDYLLATGQENPRTHILGHTITLGAQSAIHFPEAYVLYRLFFEEARRQGALSGYAHFGRWLGAEYGLGIDLPHGLLSFLEVLTFSQNGYEFWYDILNTGFRLAPIAGSDYPCLGVSLPGRERFYTQVEGSLTYEAWLEGVRHGRTFVTNGPILEFRVNGKGIGEEVVLEKPGPVIVEGTVYFDPTQDHITYLKLIENGKLVKSLARAGGDSGKMSFRIEHELRETSWLVLRAIGKKVDEPMPPFPPPTYFESTAHSAPIYVTLRDAPALLAHPRAKELAHAWLARLDDFERRLADDQIEHMEDSTLIFYFDDVDTEYLRKNRPALLEAIQTAKKYYLDLINR